MQIEVRGGGFEYTAGVPVLRDISFSLPSGNVMTVLGRNGIGKTTLIKCLTGILRWTTGRTFVDGLPVAKMSELKTVSYVPQAHIMPFSYTIEEMVCMGRAKHISALAMPSKTDREISRLAMAEVGIEDLADKPCNTLSGGQLQLAYIARALAGEPELLILDEPESHLDFKNQFSILSLIQRLVQERGLSCIMNTHYPDHALRVSDRTLLLGESGYRYGATAELLNPANIREFFHVESRIVDIGDESGAIKAFVVLGETIDSPTSTSRA